MSTKIFKLLTGFSAIAVAGLLSLVPAKTTQASVPSSAPSSVPTGSMTTSKITIYDYASVSAPAPTAPVPTSSIPIGPSPIRTTVYGSINWSYNLADPSNSPDTQTSSNPAFYFEIRRDDLQRARGYLDFIDNLNDSDNGTVSFSFSYLGTNYSGSAGLSYEAYGYMSFDAADDFRATMPPASSSPETTGSATTDSTPASTETPAPSDPAASTEPTAPADPAASTQPSAPVDPTVPSGAPLSDEEAAARAFSQAIAETVNEIEHASEGQVITCKGSGALSYRILAALAKTKGVTLIYTYEYKGIIFQSTITSELAAAAFSPEIEWYGPCFLAEHFPTGIVGVRL